MAALKHVQPGDPLRIPATAYNAFVDAARAHREGEGPGSPGQATGPSPVDILVLNAGSGDIGRFEPVTIDQPLVGPGVDLEKFQEAVVMRGSPAAETQTRWGVALDPIRESEIGRVRLAGLVQAEIQLLSSTHTHVRVTNDAAYSRDLVSAPTGDAQIVWTESAGGVTWAILRLGRMVDPVRWAVVAGTDNPPVSKVRGGSYSWYADCHPCADMSGSGADAGITLAVHFGRFGSGGDAYGYPNVFNGDVLPYAVGPSGEAICLVDVMDEPLGAIKPFSGEFVAPRGWHVCDGADGTPDLRDRFIVSEGPAIGRDTTGGTTEHTHWMPHKHGIATSQHYDYARDGGSAGLDDAWMPDYALQPPAPGWPQAAEHTDRNEPNPLRPPFYALGFMIRVE